MKYFYLYIIYILCFITNITATEWQTCLEYKFPNAPKNSWSLQDDGSNLYILNWKLTNTIPTIAELKLIEPLAIIWKSNEVINIKSDLSNWKTLNIDGELLKDAFQTLVICINKRLPATNKITIIEFKTELKNQLQN